MPGFGTNIKGCLEEIEIIYDLYGEGTFKWSDIRNIAKKSPKYYIPAKKLASFIAEQGPEP
jgi:hypothetical protein